MSGYRCIAINFNIQEAMSIRRKYRWKKKKQPSVAPGFEDERFGEDATEEDIKKGRSTKVTRVFLDENDPS